MKGPLDLTSEDRGSGARSQPPLLQQNSFMSYYISLFLLYFLSPLSRLISGPLLVPCVRNFAGQKAGATRSQ